MQSSKKSVKINPLDTRNYGASSLIFESPQDLHPLNIPETSYSGTPFEYNKETGL